MQPTEITKQVSLYVKLSEWRALRAEASRQNVPITELIRRWIDPHVQQIRSPAYGESGDSA